ncbi:MAG: asparagine--tRNA ligase [Acidobacteria bacterium]|nr:asparagine--tRNA ligase [Acidobacteriota bacterium]
MDRITIAEAGGHQGKEVLVPGWIYQKRSSGKLRFLVLRDGSGYLQAVAFQKGLSPEDFDLCDRVTLESSVLARGQVNRDDRAPGGHELALTGLELVHMADPYPIAPKEHGTAFLMDHRHLWLRSSRQHAVLRIRSAVCFAIREFFDRRGFVLIDSPIFTPAACEGTSTLFETDYFGQKAYLTQSGQLYLEPACMAFGKVYCFGPTFRAEKSKTRRHLLEFWMVEPEVAFCDLDGIIRLAEEFVAAVVERVLERCRPELATLERDVGKLERIRPPFPRITYDEAAERIRRAGHEFPFGEDFGAPHETALTESLERPLIVWRFPRAIKAFYMQPDPELPDRALGFDILAPEGHGEIIGGSQRIHDHDLLLERIRDHGLPRETFQWYLDIRRFGSVPHAGFGMGIERVVAWIAGIEHLREAIPYPRTLYRLYP